MRLGTDIIEIERIMQATNRQSQFAEKVLSSEELKIYHSFSNVNRQAEFLAGRFSAKEAYVKALGTGIGRIKMSDISILPNDKGAPVVVSGPIVSDVLVSISHCHLYATATIIINVDDAIIDEHITLFLTA